MRVDDQLRRLEAQILELQAAQGQMGHQLLRRLVHLEAALAKLLRDRRKGVLQTTQDRIPETLGLMASKGEVEDRISLPPENLLHRMCGAELFEFCRLRGVAAHPGLPRRELLRRLLTDCRGVQVQLQTEREEMAWLMANAQAIRESMPCALNCTSGCPDAMVAGCYHDNATTAAELRRQEGKHEPCPPKR